MSQLNDFSGGLNTRLNPALIDATEAVIHTNINIDSLSLMPLKGNQSELQNFGSNSSFIFFNGVWVARSGATDYVTYQNRLYYSNGVGVPQKSSNGTIFYNLGITKPTSVLTGTYTIEIPVDAVTNVRQYCYTYYNSADGSESAPSAYSGEITYVDDNITVIGFMPSSDPQVTAIRLYRVGGALTEMLLVTELPNSTTIYVDTLSDIGIDGRVLESINSGQAPIGLKFLTEHMSIFFGSVDDRLYFSDIAYPNNWNPFFVIDFDSDITGLGSTPNGLLVFTKASTYVIMGSAPTSLNKTLLHGTQGCINHKTIQYAENRLLWLSLDGVCTSNGSDVEVVTLNKLGRFKATSYDAAIWDNQYFLFHSTGTLILDYRYGKVCVRHMDLIATGAWFSSEFDKLYFITSSGSLYSLFTGTSDLTYIWKSGRLTEGAITIIKTYKVFYIYCDGTATFKLYIDGTLSHTQTLVQGLNEIKPPQEDRNGYYIELEISGTGIIREIEYKVEARQNGR